MLAVLHSHVLVVQAAGFSLVVPALGLQLACGPVLSGHQHSVASSLQLSGTNPVGDREDRIGQPYVH